MLNYAYTCFSRSLPPFGVVLLTFTAASTWACRAAHASPSQYENRPATEQPNTGGKDEKIRVAQNADGFTIDVTIDAKKNQSYIKADDQFSSFVYSATTQNNTKIIQPASKEIMETWKGNKPVSKGPFEDSDQFAPIFLVVDLTNNRATPVQVKNAYLDVSASASDLQPYLQISSSYTGCGDATYNPKFTLTNYGWGAVHDAKLTYSFGKKPSAGFTASVGTFDHTADPSVEDGLKKSVLNIAQAKAGKFKCASQSALPACLAKLKSSGIFGSLVDTVYLAENAVLTEATGRIEYDWIGSDGKSNKRSSPFAVEFPLLHFSIGGPECGAPGPVDRDNKPIALSLDKKSYRISLDWHSQLMPRQNKRLALALSAPKSSRHFAKVVLELSDGSMVASMPLDILYFTPRMPPPPKE
jgi:hypothetical protein